MFNVLVVCMRQHDVQCTTTTEKNSQVVVCGNLYLDFGSCYGYIIIVLYGNGRRRRSNAGGFVSTDQQHAVVVVAADARAVQSTVVGS